MPSSMSTARRKGLPEVISGSVQLLQQIDWSSEGTLRSMSLQFSSTDAQVAGTPLGRIQTLRRRYIQIESILPRHNSVQLSFQA